MSHEDQIPFEHPELVANPEPRCACLLLLDTSGSMHGPPITELNGGLVAFKDELMADAMAMQRVEVAVISFGPFRVHSDFQNPDTWTPPGLKRAATPRWVQPLSRAYNCLMPVNKSTSRVGSRITAHGCS